jgi:hypothetical protein
MSKETLYKVVKVNKLRLWNGDTRIDGYDVSELIEKQELSDGGCYEIEAEYDSNTQTLQLISWKAMQFEQPNTICGLARATPDG